ncbi:MAG: hypothetical protein MJ093_05605 [Saccharofermentans sp.]|nr:hypothetical protein [Saccharofermentans sp.]
MLSRLGKVKGKTKKSKQGVILVTILFILAIALIFIMSALILTTATRTRLYTRAEDNQARLTVTSAAESFYQALYLQDITDKQLQDMNNKTIRLVADGIPGMSKDNPNNMTTATFKKQSDNTMIINFETKIGNQIECIQMVLDYDDPDPVQKNFAHMLNVSKGGNFDYISLGMTVGSLGAKCSDDEPNEWENAGSGLTRADVSNNTLMFRGEDYTGAVTTGSNYYYSDFVTLGGFTCRESYFFGDVTFWGKYANYNTDDITGASITMNGGKVNFLANDKSIVHNGAAVSATNPASKNEWFHGSGSVCFYDEDANAVYFSAPGQNLPSGFTGTYSSNTTFGSQNPMTNVTAMTSDQQNAAKNLNEMDYYTVVKSDKGNDLLTGSGIAAEHGWYTSSSQVDADTSIKSIDSELSGGSIAPGTYKITGGTTMGNTTGGCPVVKLDLSKGKDYIIYITGNFTITSGYFEISGGGAKDANVYFIICSGKSLTIGGTDKSNTIAGIVSTNCYNGGTAPDGTDPIYYRNYANVKNGSCPHAFIYGMGTKSTDIKPQVEFVGEHRGVLDAYVGLYPYSDTLDDDGSFKVYSGTSVKLYGRVTCAQFQGVSGANIVLPYCPEPGSDVTSDELAPKYSDYTIYDFQYYTK